MGVTRGGVLKDELSPGGLVNVEAQAKVWRQK